MRVGTGAGGSTLPVAGRPSCQPAVQVQHSLAPLVDWIRRLEQHERANRARPLESPKRDIVRIERCVAAQKRLRRDHLAQRLEALTERVHTFLAPGTNLFELHPEPRFAILAEIFDVRRPDMLTYVLHYQTSNSGMQHAIGPRVVEP